MSKGQLDTFRQSNSLIERIAPVLSEPLQRQLGELQQQIADAHADEGLSIAAPTRHDARRILGRAYSELERLQEELRGVMHALEPPSISHNDWHSLRTETASRTIVESDYFDGKSDSR